MRAAGQENSSNDFSTMPPFLGPELCRLRGLCGLRSITDTAAFGFKVDARGLRSSAGVEVSGSDADALDPTRRCRGSRNAGSTGSEAKAEADAFDATWRFRGSGNAGAASEYTGEMEERRFSEMPGRERSKETDGEGTHRGREGGVKRRPARTVSSWDISAADDDLGELTRGARHDDDASEPDPDPRSVFDSLEASVEPLSMEG